MDYCQHFVAEVVPIFAIRHDHSAPTAVNLALKDASKPLVRSPVAKGVALHLRTEAEGVSALQLRCHHLAGRPLTQNRPRRTCYGRLHAHYVSAKIPRGGPEPRGRLLRIYVPTGWNRNALLVVSDGRGTCNQLVRRLPVAASNPPMSVP